MRITINKEKLEKVVLSTFEIDLPEETIYLFVRGIRQAYMITPISTSWNQEQSQKPEEIYAYKILVVDSSKELITTHNLPVSEIADLLNKNFNSPLFRLAEALWLSPDPSDKRTREQFMEDYDRTLNQFNKLTEEVVSKQVSTQTL